MSVRPTKAAINSGIWQAALWLCYTFIAIETVVMTLALYRNGWLSELISHMMSSGTIVSPHHPAFMASDRPWSLFESILAALIVACYFHLKMMVSTSERDRLDKLKNRPQSPNQEIDFNLIRKDDLDLIKLLLAAQVVSEDELQPVIELTAKTQRLLSDCIVGYGWITSENLLRGVALMEATRSGKMNWDDAVKQMQDARISRDLAHKTWNYEDEEEIPLPVMSKRSAKKIASQLASDAAPIETTVEAPAPSANDEASQATQPEAAPTTDSSLGVIEKNHTQSGLKRAKVAVGSFAPVAPVKVADEMLMQMKERVLSSENHLRTGQPIATTEPAPKKVAKKNKEARVPVVQMQKRSKKSRNV
ncbi:MAG TPA: hypothetical protein V6C81_32375 [Planktothrix sp.]|jgi:ribosomal protein L21